MRGARTLLHAGIAAALVSVNASAQAETLVERGRYLAETIAACGNCHTPKNAKGQPIREKKFAGGFEMREKPFTAVSANITQDKETGIGEWTDDQIARAIREGIRPDGSLIGPPMPFELYRKLSDRDVRALVAYLRTIKPVRNRVAKSVYRMPLPKSYGPPVKSVPEVPRTDKVAYGAYLAGPVGHCIECHTPMVKGRRDWSRTGSGGQPFETPVGVFVARNITPHPDDGIGTWADAQIERAIREGVSEDGSRLGPPMAFPWYRGITKADMAAIIAYLRSLPPLPNP